VAAITVRVIADGAGGVCALAETASVSRPTSSIPFIGNRMMGSSTVSWKHYTRSFPEKAGVFTHTSV
jgi:hypothetical protein